MWINAGFKTESCFPNFSVLHPLFGSHEPKAPSKLIGWDSSRRLSVRGSTFLTKNISENSQQKVIKFHLEHYWGKGLAALDFGPDRIRTLVSMATIKSWMGSKFGKIRHWTVK